MVSVETISIVFTGLSVSLAAFYYINTLRNAQRTQQMQLETRQTQIFMQIFQQLNSEASMTTWAELHNLEFDDYEDFMRKYDSSINPENFGKRGHIFHGYNMIGFLLMEGLISIDLVNMLVGNMAVMQWQKWGGHHHRGQREADPQLFLGIRVPVERADQVSKRTPGTKCLDSQPSPFFMLLRSASECACTLK
jgi:hypothetical protein